MAKFKPLFPSHFYGQGAQHPSALRFQCFWSRWLEADYNHRLVSPLFSLSGRFYWKSHWFGPVPALNEKWPISRFISPSKFTGRVWQFSNQALTEKPSASRGWIHNQKQNPVIQPSAAALAPLQGEQILLISSISGRNSSVHTIREHTYFRII